MGDHEQRVIDICRERLLLDITEEQATRILDANEGAIREELQGFGMDTGTREMIAERVAQEFTGMSWPCYGTDKDETEQFYKKLAAAVERGELKKVEATNG